MMQVVASRQPMMAFHVSVRSSGGCSSSTTPTAALMLMLYPSMLLDPRISRANVVRRREPNQRLTLYWVNDRRRSRWLPIKADTASSAPERGGAVKITECQFIFADMAKCH